MNQVELTAFQKAIKESYQPQYQSIIFGALKRLHQTPYQENWDDMVQEARIALASKLMSRDNGKKQGSYLYQCVYWRILDLLRSRQRRVIHQSVHSDDSQLPVPVDENMAEIYARHENDQLFKQLKVVLTLQQQAYLDLLLQGYSDTEIALSWHCSRQAIHNLRHRVIEKGRRLFSQNE